MKTILALAAVSATAAALVLPGVASAKPGTRSFDETFPVASALCAKGAANTLPKRLQGDQSQIAGYCATLQSAYNAAVTTGQTAETTFTTGVQTARSAVQAACPTPRTTQAERQACRQARRQGQLTITSLRGTWRLAVRQFHVSIEQARLNFWSAIHALRGGAGITPDQPMPNAPIPTS